jgi:hypothetical protein
MGFAKIKGELVSRKGQRVNYKAPNDVRAKGGDYIRGEIIDEIWADETINTSPAKKEFDLHDWGDYSFFAQLIKWDEGGYNLRMGYYRRRAGEDWWEFAGQTTISGEPNGLKSLLEKTLAKKEWFEVK